MDHMAEDHGLVMTPGSRCRQKYVVGVMGFQRISNAFRRFVVDRIDRNNQLLNSNDYDMSHHILLLPS